MIVCCFWFLLIWITVQLKRPTKDSAVQIYFADCFKKHHTNQIIKADGAAGDWVFSPNPETGSGQHLEKKSSYTGVS